MCIETLEPGKPRYTLTKQQGTDIQIMTHNRRPILTTDHDALIQYAAMRAKMNPLATYSIGRVNHQMEL
jgi:hypothetical protein